MQLSALCSAGNLHMIEEGHGDSEHLHFHFDESHQSLNMDSDGHEESSHLHIQTLDNIHSLHSSIPKFDHVWRMLDLYSVISRSYRPDIPPPNLFN